MAPSTPFMAALVWLGYVNIVLAIFNMIPGYPMDGGRVLRAIIWHITGNMNRSTRVAAHVGQFVATFFIVWGVFQFFFGMGFGGLWLAMIGWFLLTARQQGDAVEVRRRSYGPDLLSLRPGSNGGIDAKDIERRRS